MFLHLSVSHSVHRGVCLSACWNTQTPLWADTPWADTQPWVDTPCPVHAGIHTTPCPVHAGIHTPLASACWHTQCPVHAGIEMATAVDGTHPTGMHSCQKYELNFSSEKMRTSQPIQDYNFH